MKYLLPHRFKRIGVIIAPLGFFLWYAVMKNYVRDALIHLFGTDSTGTNTAPYHITCVIIAIASFFSFLGGIYFMAFSKEKIEDEMVRQTRLESFQFAALIQIIFVLLGFVVIGFVWEPGNTGFILFFTGLILLFWISFIARFNYILHIKFKE
jgi:hypothetical protein